MVEHPALTELARGADHIDGKDFRGRADQARFLSALFTYRPGWLRLLYAVRGGLARLMGLWHPSDGEPDTGPPAVPMTPGAMVGAWRVVAAEEGRFWAAEIADRHLRAILAVESRPEADFWHHRLTTLVFYRHWTGPVYFNIIRPFHHLVVWAMGRHASK